MNTDNDKLYADCDQSFYESLFKCGSFGEHMRVIINAKGWDTAEFCMWTELNASMFSRIKRESYIPDIRTFVTLCVSMELDMLIMVRLLQFTKINVLQKDTLLQKYFDVIDNCRGKDIAYCNEVLKGLGVEDKCLLGTRKNREN